MKRKLLIKPLLFLSAIVFSTNLNAQCPEVTDIAAPTITENKADITWTAGGTETAWSVEWGEPGFTPGNSEEEGFGNPVTPSFEIIGLSINTSYEVYIQADCGTNGLSDWEGPFNFVTNCVSSTGDTTATACDSFEWFGNTYTSSGTPTHTLTGAASNGCDSIVTLNLTINNAKTKTVTVTACDSFDWHGTTYTVSGPQIHTIEGGASNGCDSIVTLNLTINNSATKTETVTACDDFEWYGTTYTASGIQTHVISGVSANGCDSIMTLDLTINNSVTGTDTQIACNSYTWIDGNEYTANNNTATHTLTAANGCDSVVTLDLTFATELHGIDTQIACDSLEWIDGNTYYSSTNSVTHTLVGGAAQGCDSIVTLNLTINNSVTGTDTQTACNSFTWIDGNEYIADNTTATYTLTAANGCDSVVTLNLTFVNEVYGVDTQTACGSFTWIDDNVYTSDNNSATHTITGGSATGCDSVVTLNLTFVNEVYGVDTQTACGSFTWIDGVTYTSSNTTATETLVGGSVHGCDSIVTLNLTINNAVTGVDTQVACDTFTWIDGNDYTVSNNTVTHTIVGGASNGCDSIVTLDLTINNSETGIDTQVACYTYTWIDGVTYTASNTTATHTIPGVATDGCDSIMTLDLTINESNLAGDDNTINVCKNEPFDLAPLLSSGAQAGGTWISPAHVVMTSTQVTASNVASTYDYRYEVNTGICPSVAIITVIVAQDCDYLAVSSEELMEVLIYPNPATDKLTIENPSNTSSLKVEMLDMNGRVVLVENKALNNASEATLSIDHLERGIYTLRVYNDVGQKTFKVVKQ